MAKERVVSRNSSRPLLQRAKGRSLLDPARRSMATATAGKKRKRSMKAKATVKADSFSEDSDIDDIQQDDIDPSKPRRSSRLEKKQTAVETKATTDAISEESSDDNDLKSDNEDTAEEDNGDSDADEDTEDDSYTDEVDSEVDETYQEEGREKDGEYAVPSLDHTRHAEEVENVAVEASSPFGENSPLSYSPNTHGRHKRRKLRRPASSTSSSIPASDAAELGIIEEDETFAIAFMDSPSRNATPITIGTSKGLRSDSPKSRLTTHNKKSSSLAEKLALRLEQESSELDLSKHVVVPEIRFDRQDSKEQEDENIHENESGDDVDGEEMIIDFYNESSERKLVHGEDLHPEMQLDPVNVEDLDIHPAPSLIEKKSSTIDQTEPTKDQDNTHENQGDGTQNRGFWSLLFGRKSSASDEENTREQGDPKSSNESEEPSFWSRLLPYGPHYDL